MFKKIVFLVLGFSTILSCKNQESEPAEIPQEQIAFTQEGKLQIFKQNEEKVYFNIEIADTDYETETGLMYRESMKQNQAMLFVFKDENLQL